MDGPQRPAGPSGHQDGTAKVTGRRRLFRPWQLRTKLVAITLALLAAMSLAVGLFAYGAMEQFLSGRLNEQLEQASSRALHSQEEFRPDHDHDDDDDEENAGEGGPAPADPLTTPGQGVGTLNARISENGMRNTGIFTPDGERQELTAADKQILTDLELNAPPVERMLSVGEYRLIARWSPHREATIVTGLPLLAKEQTLDSLTRTMTGVSLVGLGAAALLGALIIHRTLRPLEELSGVATRVSRLPLEEGEVAMAERVPARIAVPVTEVGRLGHAFNMMLNNVAGAFSARHRSEVLLRQFVADASHELRTPLTAIRGYSEMIRLTERLSPQGRSSLGKVESETQRMTALVEDLLLLARMDEGQRAEQSDVDLTALVAESVNDVRATAPGHRWVLNVPDDPVTIRANQSQLRQVLTNLLANARQHTGDGTTVVTSLAEEEGQVQLSVADDGPGIPEDFIGRIFSRFSRADTARSDRSGTHGLGLSIVKAIVTSHEGTVDVDSQPGRTEFVVRLPRDGTPAPAQ
ncbi:signal transduction histidine kinase [Arthrobacter crystallopoietes BAB-32]|uniref:histidine kinase n=1 Tax=Arthrobacter crystallopoietes BAB-32 TaxID=1246476 RepID=N1V510_9MICC|nr:HAMP domain-containing sensor histidine kinase [Arthrobacter crystallopoietes]EMY35109.1 signal transduction histidine kinase [Arthrobacter crystallopoietes BAB-32]